MSMRTRRVRVVRRVAIGAVVGLGVAPAAVGTAMAATPTPVTSCGQVITAPGTYQLTADLDCAAMSKGDAIDIESADVTLDLNGHAIRGPGSSVDVTGIYEDQPDVTITSTATSDGSVVRGSIQGFDVGVNINGTTYDNSHDVLMPGAVVDQVDISASGRPPTTAGGGDGIEGHFLDAPQISSLDLSNERFGIFLFQSAGGSVTGNDLTGDYYGVSLFDYGSTVSHNTVADPLGVGVMLQYASQAVVTDNSVTDGHATGIYSLDSEANNTISDNSVNDLHIGIADNESAFGDVFTGNTGTGDDFGLASDAAGILDAFSSRPPVYTHNTFDDGRNGMVFDNPASFAAGYNVTDGNTNAGLAVGNPLPGTVLLTYETADDNRYGLYSNGPIAGPDTNTASGNTVVNCYNVSCTGSGGAAAAAPVARAAPVLTAPALPGAAEPRLGR